MTAIELEVNIDANTRKRPVLILEGHEQNMNWVGNGWSFSSSYFVVGEDRDVDLIAFCQGNSGDSTCLKVKINSKEELKRVERFIGGALAFDESVHLPSTSN